ncbi:hypothetical protein ASD04_17870 [Devosia sp. Root436]|uniref:hypothetical protein n=1 Tax=Devosia sp. Root436 TaxID=1736537 RepID=UPI0006F7858E|nr:hypothetical protein [Devosia sp. Root436]KQX34109.1 hypothetical protein ASD04_17870 [Devosia sp. Root436]
MAMLKPCADCRQLVYAEAMVTITAVEYRDLLSRPAREGGYLGKPSRSKLDNDTELAAHLVELAAAGKMLLTDMRNACIERFGAERVPSRSAIHRYLQMAAHRERMARLRSDPR